MSATLKDELEELVRKAEEERERRNRCSQETNARAERRVHATVATKAQKIIDSIPVLAKEAAKVGKHEARVYGPNYDMDGHCVVLHHNILLGGPALNGDHVASIVYRFCQEQGLNPCADYLEVGYGDYRAPNQIRITIRW